MSKELSWEGNKMTDWKGFWSYVHADEKAEKSRISNLAHDVVDQIQMLTGESIDLFLDQDGIEWGDKWHDKINKTLSSIAFFIPVLTPRYFKSPECRRELQFFLRQATELGINDLILPLLYLDVPELENKNTTDDLIKLIQSYQWEDWRELRFLEVNSEGYRRGVTKLAKRLVKANLRVEQLATQAPIQVGVTVEGTEDDTPGTIDLLAKYEEKLDISPGVLNEIGKYIVQISEIMNDATGEMKNGDAQGKGFSARLSAARRAANRMREPVERIWSLSNDYASNNHDIDAGVRIIIDRAQFEVKENPETAINYCKVFESICNLSSKSNQAIESTQGLIDATGPLEAMSKDLRPVIRKLKQGLTVLIESAGVSNEWVQLIDSTGITCE